MGGNLLLDIGPLVDGTIPKEQINILTELGNWNSKNSDAIFNSLPRMLQEHFYGPSTFQRRGGDSNPRFALRRTTVFETAAIDHSATSPEKINPQLRVSAEREGFEPPDPRRSTVFKTAAIDHSAISPRQKYIIFKYLNCLFLKFTFLRHSKWQKFTVF
jgi:hypothetical protein